MIESARRFELAGVTVGRPSVETQIGHALLCAVRPGISIMTWDEVGRPL